MVGFRTATHAFLYDGKGPHAKWNDDFGRKVWGQRWITHHGHHGERMLTDVKPVAAQKDHPVLRGVGPFQCPSWLYHVEGGGDKIHGDYTPLLVGTSLVSSHAKGKNPERFPTTQPVAWTKTARLDTNKEARVFFTTLGHPHDFKAESMRRMVVNGIYWALGMEKQIPAGGCNADPVGGLDLTTAAFGGHKKGVRPAERE
jgi:type 1 glutamine amidotransferase